MMVIYSESVTEKAEKVRYLLPCRFYSVRREEKYREH